MRKPIIWIFSILFVLLVIILSVVTWERGAFPGFSPEIVDVNFQSISQKNRAVRITGVARYDTVSKMKLGDTRLYIFPLLPEDDMNGNVISVVVQTKRQPDKYTTIEKMTVEGFVRPPGSAIPDRFYQSWSRRGYHFSANLLFIQSYDSEDFLKR